MWPRTGFSFKFQMQPVAMLKEEIIMVPLINFMMQLERDPEHAIRQAETSAQNKALQRETGKALWFSTIMAALSTYATQILGSGHGRRIEQKSA
jgi:hypothetical protein